jgi:RimJ/RimL family protein N-acetyltransferase
VKPTDEPALSEMLYSLSKSSVRTRYFTHTMTFPHKDVQKLANIDYDQELAIVGVVPGPGGEEIVAIAQYFLDPKTMSAEVAFIVQDEWQQKGMGTYLLRYLTRIARERGVRRFYAKVLRANRAMLAIFENCGYELHKELDADTYSLWYDLDDAAGSG